MAEKKSEMEAARGIDPQLVEILGEIATRLDLSEVEVAHGDLKIRVARQISVAPIPVATVAAAPAPAPAARPAAAPAAMEMHPGMITSPMVGTAYRRPSPDAAVRRDRREVKAGERSVLIEAMKTFNEIVAPRAGTVTAILVEDVNRSNSGSP